MSCQPQGTADTSPSRCSGCGYREHGSIACNTVVNPVIWDFDLGGIKLAVTYRVIDDTLFRGVNDYREAQW